MWRHILWWKFPSNSNETSASILEVKRTLHLGNAFEVFFEDVDKFFAERTDLFTDRSIFIVWVRIHTTAFQFCVVIRPWLAWRLVQYRTLQRLSLVLQESHVMSYCCHQILSWQFVSDHFSLFASTSLSVPLSFFPTDKFLQYRLNSHSLLVTEFLGVKHNTFYFSFCAVLFLVERFI